MCVHAMLLTRIAMWLQRRWVAITMEPKLHRHKQQSPSAF